MAYQKIKSWLDNFLWNHSRKYRAQMRYRRVLTSFPQCEFCGTRFGVIALRNHSHICVACQGGFEI